MNWLNALIGSLLSVIGLNASSRISSSVQFFLYDVIKITVLLCVLIFIVSYIQSYFPPERSRKIMGRFHGFWASCIATFSFLISSPMVDLGSLVLLMSIFGYKIAVAYVVLGLMVAISGGMLIEHLHMEKYVEDFIKNVSSVEIDSPDPSQREGLILSKNQVVSTFKKVFPYIVLGVGIGTVIHNWIPEAWISSVLGNRNPFGVVLATLIGVPIYADIFGTIPVAEALLAKGAQLGTVLSFMMAVTTLSVPSMVMLGKAIKPKLLGLFIAICTIGIIAVGYFFNAFHYLFI